MRRASFRPGQTVFEQGERGSFGYFVLEGAVEIRRLSAGARIVLARLGRGALFGELALFDDRPRAGTAVAVEPTACLVLSRADVRRGLAPLDPVARLMVDGLVQYVRTSIRLVDQARADTAVLEPPKADDIDFEALVRAILAERSAPGRRVRG